MALRLSKYSSIDTPQIEKRWYRIHCPNLIIISHDSCKKTRRKNLHICWSYFISCNAKKNLTFFKLLRKKCLFFNIFREMTAKLVADGDPTEAALAELYAYVQSQPESEVKKKWVNKFNKENGCGTPKVILNSSITEACAKNCKSLSHSIRVI